MVIKMENQKMKIFISWSGDRSREIAENLGSWISFIVHTIEPFVSSEDIVTGELWRSKIAKELQTSNFGIVCITPENRLSPWILFEAGALSKNEDSRVVPLLFETTLSDISDNPVSAYQGLIFSIDSMKKLVWALNVASGNRYERSHLDTHVDMMFDKSNENINKVLKMPKNIIGNMANSTKPCVDISVQSNTPDIVKSLLSWGYDISSIVRTKQTYNFVMEDWKLKIGGKSAVKITGTHVYTVVNKSENDLLKISMDMRDELGLQSREEGWGFESLFYTLEGDERAEYPIELADSGDGAKKNLTFAIDIPPKKSIKFEFVSAGVFLPSDRYSWYSQEFCEDCVVFIANNTKIVKIQRYQINHRDEEKIKTQIKYRSNPNKINIDSNIYPREGFTMYWKSIEE